MAEAYRADHLGSLLRTAQVKEARAAVRAGRMTQAQLREAEDRAILQALERQKQIGVDVFSDGEFRRKDFQRDLAESVEGFVATERAMMPRVWRGPGGQPQETLSAQVVGGKLKQLRRLTENQTSFLKLHAPGPFKMTVPSPNQFPQMNFQPGLTERFYATRSDLLWEIVKIIKAEISALVAEGVPYIQMDAPRYALYVDPQYRRQLQDRGEDSETLLQEAVAADNACLEGAKRAEITSAIHICRGNNQSRWYAEGGYEPIAEELFGTLAVDRFLLEYDTERAGSFEPLRFVPPHKMVVLGLVTTKEPRLESQDNLLRRIDEASRYVPLDRLALSPQCGFASVAEGNLLTEDDQWRKLELVVETARKVWG